jgi:hypothetical protein
MASGVSAPSPSLGAEAAVVAKVRSAMQILQQAVGSVDVSGELGKAILKAIEDLAKVAPSSMSTGGMEQTAQASAVKDAQKKAMLLALIKKAQQSGQGAGGPMPGAAPAPAPEGTSDAA